MSWLNGGAASGPFGRWNYTVVMDPPGCLGQMPPHLPVIQLLALTVKPDLQYNLLTILKPADRLFQRREGPHVLSDALADIIDRLFSW